jgi:hypothetical protein
MNERIKKLKEQATKIVETTDHCSGASESHAEVDLEKFAELIVIKCAEIADTAEPFLASDLIKQHFGVTE